jgi:hypothetical protein
MRFPAAVKAMSIAVLMDVIFAPSIRVKERRWVCASTTAILLRRCKDSCILRSLVSTYIGTPISEACFSAACRATLAPFCVSVGNVAVAAAVGAMLIADVMYVVYR